MLTLLDLVGAARAADGRIERCRRVQRAHVLVVQALDVVDGHVAVLLLVGQHAVVVCASPPTQRVLVLVLACVWELASTPRDNDNDNNQQTNN